MSTEPLLHELERVAEVPDATDCFRAFIVELALRGDLTASDPVRLSAKPVNFDQILQGMEPLVHPRPRYRWAKSRLAQSPQFEPPQGWLATELANTGLYINGIAFKPSDWGTSGRPIIRIQNLSGLNRDYNYATGDFPEDNLVNTGDLLVSWSATLDTYLWEGPQGVVNQHIFKVIPNLNAVTSKFLYWLLKHEVRQLAKSQHAHGLAMMHINRGPFLEHAVLLPPLVEQDRIVAKVEELMALCDQLELAQKERELQRDALRSVSLYRLTAADEDAGAAAGVRFFLDTSPRLITKPNHVAPIRQAILDLAVRGRLVPQDPGDEPAAELLLRLRSSANGSVAGYPKSQSEPFHLPTGWEWVRFPELGKFGRGKSKHRPRNDPVLYAGGLHPFIQTGDVARSGGLIRTFSTLYNDTGLAQSQMWPAGTLCITIAANIADSGVLTFDACFPDSVVGLIVSSEFTNCRYFEYFLRTAKADLHSFAPSTAQKNINLSILGDVMIPLPPLEELNRIVARVDELMDACDELEAALKSAQWERGKLLGALLHDTLGENNRSTAAIENAVSAV
jgi:type I restriction enzyme S subunit